MYKLEDLKIWNKAIDITEKVYALSSGFPDEEKFGLTSQIQRSVVSVASNIAEGAGRNTKGEFKNFLSMAHGSSYELFTQLVLSQRLGLSEKESITPLLDEIIEIQKMNYKLIKSLY